MGYEPMLEKRRAVGEIMAALILMLIASLAGVILFTTTVRTSSAQGSILRSQILAESASVQEQFQVLNAVPDNGNLKIWIYNYGKYDIEITDIYINGKRTDFYLNGKIDIYSDEPPVKLTINLPTGVSGPVYKITIVSNRGVKNVSEWSE